MTEEVTLTEQKLSKEEIYKAIEEAAQEFKTASGDVVAHKVEMSEETHLGLLLVQQFNVDGQEFGQNIALFGIVDGAVSLDINVTTPVPVHAVAHYILVTKTLADNVGFELAGVDGFATSEDNEVVYGLDAYKVGLEQTIRQALAAREAAQEDGPRIIAPEQKIVTSV